MTAVDSKTDARIHHDILEELSWDSRVDETEVGVEVDGGVVTLTGTVTSWAKRLAAQEAVRRVAGVRDVANGIAVKTPGGSSGPIPRSPRRYDARSSGTCSFPTRASSARSPMAT